MSDRFNTITENNLTGYFCQSILYVYVCKNRRWKTTMLDRNRLNEELSKEGITVRELAGRIGMSEDEFDRKVSSGQFGLQDAEAVIQALNLKDPETIFFPVKVT
ncbi:MAG: hypothetical protein IKO25_08635 [Clostridia bacterium]|nr:hypothetical protein [Clostridia bacterium]